MFTIDLPKEIERRLLVLAMQTGRTVQFCAREAILDYIDEVEDRILAIDRIAESEVEDKYKLDE
jgi:RHH-type rel operon transcriptional repressor/antitoxin RelB